MRTFRVWCNKAAETDTGSNILVDCSLECSCCLSVQHSSQQLGLFFICLLKVKEKKIYQSVLLWTRLHIILASSTLFGIKVLRSASALNPFPLPSNRTWLCHITQIKNIQANPVYSHQFLMTLSPESLCHFWICPVAEIIRKCHVERPLAPTSLFQLCTAIMR